jgi:hypothetical protein
VQRINELVRRNRGVTPRLHGSSRWRLTPPPSSGSISRPRMISLGVDPLYLAETFRSRLRANTVLAPEVIPCSYLNC